MKKNIIIFLSILIMLVAVISVIVFFTVLYPIKYKDLVKKYSLEFGLNSSLVYSIINVESGFNKNAKSKAGAIGLMQIMPETAKEISQKLNESFIKENLYNPEINIKYGCFYLNYLMKQFNNNINNVIASYNAGLNNVNEWLKSNEFTKNETIIKTPFSETTRYLKKVNNNIRIYKFLAK